MHSRVTEALKAARETRCLELDGGVLDRTPARFREFFPGKAPLVVADTNTLAVAGQRVFESFRQAGLEPPKPFVFSEPGFYAEHRHVEVLQEVLNANPDAVLVAVGSGTINDLAKLSSHRAGRPYMSVGTAASMDGYTSFGASITYRGNKQNFDCPAPRVAIADIDILRGAPPEMSASGYADLLAKIVAGADWLVADALQVEPLQPTAWTIIQGGLRDAVAEPTGIPVGKMDAITKLTEGLLLSGFAMQSASSSRPAAGAEHQFSHLWDMQHHTHQGTAPSHGFKVGIATLAVAALYEVILRYRFKNLDIESCCARWPTQSATEKTIRDLFGDGELAEVAVAETRAKALETSALRSQLQTLKSSWPALRERLRQQLVAFGELKRMLAAAGAPSEPEHIGISRERLSKSFVLAMLIRRRFTVLDLAARTGLLESSLNLLFGADGPWPHK